MNSKRWFTGASILFVLAMLAACGGGGGDGSTAAPPPDNSTAALPPDNSTAALPPDNSTAAPPPDNSTTAPPPDNVAGFAYVGNQGTNNVSAYTINATTGELSEVAGSPFAAGTGPESVSVHPSGRFAYVANSGSSGVPGNVSAYAIDPSTGALSEITGSPFATGNSTRAVAVDPSGRFAYVVDNFPGGVVSVYAIDAATGALSRVGAAVAAGFSPSSIAVDPSGRFAYVANFEGDFLSNVFAYTIGAGTGALSAVAGSPFTAGLDPTGVTVDPSGRFVYVANRQSGDISAYAIDGATGAVSEIAGSPFVGGIDLAVDPSGKFAYVAGNGILAYSINTTTGALAGIGAYAAGAGAYRVAVDPSGQFAYAVNRDGNDISAYRINATSGALSSIGAAVAAGLRPQAIATTRRIQ